MVIRDEELGSKEEEQVEKVNAYNRAAGTLDFFSSVAGGVFLFLPKYYLFSFGLCVVAPILAIGLIHISRGRESPSGLSTRYTPGVSLSLFLPPLIMLIRVLMDINFVSFPHIVWFSLIPLCPLEGFWPKSVPGKKIVRNGSCYFHVRYLSFLLPG